VRVLIGSWGRKKQIFRRTPQHAHAVNQASQKSIGRDKLKCPFRRKDSGISQSAKRLVEKRGSQWRVSCCIPHLKDLNAVLKVHKAPGAVFRVQSAGFCLLLELPLSKITKLFKIDLTLGVDHLVPEALKLLSEFSISSDRSEPNQGNSLIGEGIPVGSIIATKPFKAGCERTGVPIGAKPEIQLKDAFPFGLDKLCHPFHEKIKKL
jgi:hypothetical protein